ncbi:MAG: O-antigen ligase family protein [Bryobacteraceae bacterium]|nr:O-antigen ligase family protein [Bryobacteraceae bacterium]
MAVLFCTTLLSGIVPHARITGLILSLIALLAIRPVGRAAFIWFAPLPLAIAQLPLSEAPRASAAFVGDFATAGSAFALAHTHSSLSSRAWRVMAPFVALALLQAGMGLMQVSQTERLPSGSVGNHSQFAALLAMALPFSVAQGGRGVGSATPGQRIASIGWVGVSLLLFFAILASRSRMGLVSALLGLALLLLLVRAGRVYMTKRRWVALGLCSILLIAVGALASHRLLAARFASTLQDLPVEAWVETAEKASERPLLGIGLGAHRTQLGRHAENDYLEFLVETGVPGLLLFLVSLATLGVILWRRLRHGTDRRRRLLAAAALTSFCLVLVHSLIESNLHYPYLMFATAWITGAGAGLPKQESAY